MKNSKNFKRLTVLALGFALVSGSSLATVGNANATANTATPANIARYKHIPTVATIDRRQVVRYNNGASLVTWSTDANGAGWIDSINLTTNLFNDR